MHNVERIETLRLCLRRPKPADTRAFFDIHSDPGTNSFNTSGLLRSYAQAEAAMVTSDLDWNRDGHSYWAVSTREQESLVIGFGGLGRRLYGDVVRLNLGFRFATSAWGQGFATELAKASLEISWNVLGATEVWASARENHLASRRVLEKIGMSAAEVVTDARSGAAASVWYVVRAESTRGCILTV